MSPTSIATVAAYYLYGLEAGIVSVQQAKDWAFSIIESVDNPPAEIIEVAMSGGLPELFEKLKSVSGERDPKQAGRWLLYLLRQSLEADPSNLKRIVRQAIQVARSADLEDDEYYKLDAIDDAISLAEQGIYGSLEMCRADLVAALAKYPKGVEGGT